LLQKVVITVIMIVGIELEKVFCVSLGRVHFVIIVVVILDVAALASRLAALVDALVARLGRMAAFLGHGDGVVK
jgi:hypothetical protein